MESLPGQEQRIVWQEIERNFWDEMKRKWQEEQETAEEEHHRTTMEVQVEVARLNGQCSQLIETQKSLAEQLAQVEAELSRKAQERNDKANTFCTHELDYQEHQQQRLAKRGQVIKTMTDYFQYMLGKDASVESNGASGESDEVLRQSVTPMQGMVRTGQLIASQETNHAVRAAVNVGGDYHHGEDPNGATGQATRDEADTHMCMTTTAEVTLTEAAGLDFESTTESDPTSQMADSDRLTMQETQGPEQLLLTPAEPRDHPPSGGFTLANGRSRSPSHDAPTPTVDPTEASPRPTDALPTDALFEEITRENLILRDDGTVYTYPDCVQGVPLVKIDESHPYWDPSWPNVKSVIEPALRIWKEKNQAIRDNGSKGKKKDYAKYQTGRQVNRGHRILSFLDEGEINPYQLLSKRYTKSATGSIISYDTLFRLAETLSELSKFNLKVKPVEWLRHRLHELIVEKGPAFNYTATIHSFYHDEKLSTLRAKHGFKNIGRPRMSVADSNKRPKCKYRCEKINTSTGKICNEIFTRSRGLNRHQNRLHNPQRRKVCCIDCNPERTFGRQDYLIRHRRRFHPDKEPPTERHPGGAQRPGIGPRRLLRVRPRAT
jgi:hypothetical protein